MSVKIESDLCERCLTGWLLLPHFVESVSCPTHPRPPGMFQFSQSLSDRLTRQDNPHPYFLHIQFD